MLNKTQIRKIKFKKIKIFAGQLPRLLAEHVFMVFLALVFLAIISGALLFYKYSVLIKKAEPQFSPGELIEFKENIYQEILTEWQNREERFKAADTQKYPDPFQP